MIESPDLEGAHKDHQSPTQGPTDPTAALCCSLHHWEKPPASHSPLPVQPD